MSKFLNLVSHWKIGHLNTGIVLACYLNDNFTQMILFQMAMFPLFRGPLLRYSLYLSFISRARAILLVAANAWLMEEQNVILYAIIVIKMFWQNISLFILKVANLIKMKKHNFGLIVRSQILVCITRDEHYGYVYSLA